MKKFLKELTRYLLLTVGTLIFSIGVALFLNPLDLAPGGVTGIAIITSHLFEKYLFSLSVGTVLLCINIPLMIVAFIKFGAKFFFSTAYVSVLSSVTIDALTWITKGAPIITENLLLGTIASGVCIAVGIGTVFNAGGTTGGSDIVIKLLRKKYRHINTGTIFFLFDLAVIATSAVVFWNIENILYALIFVFVNSRVIDFMLYGHNKNKLVYIISDKSEQIAERFMNELDLGVTFVDGAGAYTGKEKRIIMCAIRNQAFPNVRRVVKEEDKKAFLIAGDATAIFGERYNEIDDKEDL